MRYVILFHELPASSARASHWDFMLEADGSLATWELRHPPDVVVRQPCRRLADHRLAYLDYEGPVASAGGIVTQWDAGAFEWLAAADDLYQAQFNGQRLKGIATWQRQQNQRWTFSFSSTLG